MFFSRTHSMGFSAQLLDVPTDPEKCLKCGFVGSRHVGEYLECRACGLIRHQDAHRPAPLSARIVDLTSRDSMRVTPGDDGYNIPHCACGCRFYLMTDPVRYVGAYCPTDAFITARCALCLTSVVVQLVGAAGKRIKGDESCQR